MTLFVNRPGLMAPACFEGIRESERDVKYIFCQYDMIQTRKDLEIIDTSLKYQYLIEELNVKSPCPNNCRPVEFMAFRFVQSTEIGPEQFLPTELEDRLNNRVRKSNNETQICTKCAVSFYDSEDNAINKLKFLSAQLKNKWTKNYIACGRIGKNDGIASSINTEGHFSFYQYNKSDYYTKFIVITQIF